MYPDCIGCMHYCEVEGFIEEEIYQSETEAINWSEFEERSADEILGAFE